VTEKEPEKTQPLDTVKARIRSILEDQKARDLAAEKIGRLEKSALREKSLDVAAQKEGYKVKATGALKTGQALEEIDPAGSISQTLFGLKDREISGAIPCSPEPESSSSRRSTPPGRHLRGGQGRRRKGFPDGQAPRDHPRQGPRSAAEARRQGLGRNGRLSSVWSIS